MKLCASLLLFVTTTAAASPSSLPSPDVLERHARSVLAESDGDAEVAIAWAESAAALDPGSSFAQSRVALLHEESGEDSAALERGERALTLDSLNSDAAMLVGRMRCLAGQPGLAVRALTPSLRRSGAKPELFALRALAHQAGRNYRAALADLGRTGPLLSSFDWVATQILSMALEDGRLHEAHAAFDLAIRLRPDDARTITLGLSLARQTGNLGLEQSLERALHASELP